MPLRAPLVLPALLLLLAVLVRLPSLAAPPFDAHHVRQSDTGSMARIMAREGIDLLRPRVAWAGPEAGPVEAELPLYAAGVALGLRWFGEGERSVAWARGLSVAAWILGGLALLATVRRRLPGPPAFYLLLYLFSPLALVFSRNVQPDPTALALLLLAWERADAASDGGSGPRGFRDALLAGLLAGVAVAAKGPLAFLLPLIPLLPLSRRGGPGARGAALLALPAFAIPALWYWHAHRHLAVDGASFGLWGAGAGKWGEPGIWSDGETWRAILGTGLVATLSPLGLALLVGGAPGLRRAAELRPFATGILAVGVSALVLADGFRRHNYYQLALLPFASVLAGEGIRRFRAWFVEPRGPPWIVRGLGAAAGGMLLLLSVLGGAGFVRDSLRQDERIPRIAAGAAAVLPPGHAVLVVDEHPQSLLFAVDRNGWHRMAVDAEEVLRLEELGARWMLLTDSSSSWEDGALRAKLGPQRAPAAIGVGWVLVPLRPPREQPPPT